MESLKLEHSGVLMVFNTAENGWKHVDKKNMMHLEFLESPTESCYKLSGKSSSDNIQRFCINLHPGTKVGRLAVKFVNFKDGSTNYGVMFGSSEAADSFQKTFQELQTPSAVPGNFTESASIGRKPSISPSIIAPSTPSPTPTSGVPAAPPAPSLPPAPPPPSAPAVATKPKPTPAPSGGSSGIGDLSSALAGVKLKKAPPPSEKAASIDKPSGTSGGGGDMMSEMAAKLARRKNLMQDEDSKVYDVSAAPTSAAPVVERRQVPVPKQQSTPAPSFPKEKPTLRPQPATQGKIATIRGGATVSSGGDLETLKKELMEFIKSEMADLKEAIIREIRESSK